MASLTSAQNIGLVTDTNGNIITGRTNELTFTNNLRFGTLTNANARTAIIGTNGALTAGNPPSGAAANGALLTADGAGGSSFVASRVQFVALTNDIVLTNWNFNTASQTVNRILSVNVDANSIYNVRYVSIMSQTNQSVTFAHALTITEPFAATVHRAGWGQSPNTSLSSIAFGGNTNTTVSALPIGGAISNLTFMVAGETYIHTLNAATLYYNWTTSANTSNAATLLRGTFMRVEKMWP